MTDAARWIEDFSKKNGRPPRILHMGNICNNAYQTAKMLNAAGADCDVYNADDYYIMACPEWDETEITEDLGNLYYPLLHKANLHGFVRPRWFAQGPMPDVLDYLIAKRSGQTRRANRLWKRLARIRRSLSSQNNSALSSIFASAVTSASAFFKNIPNAIRKFYSAHLYYIGSVITELFTQPTVLFKRVRQKLGLLSAEESKALAAYDEAAREEKRRAMLSTIIDQDVLNRVLRDAETLFPEREIHFDTQLEGFMLYLDKLRTLFSHYDLIQAYAHQTIWPYLAEAENYIAYEHGTLRDYVYEETDWSRLTLLAYATAGVIYVTNVDCYESATYIAQHGKVPIVCGLHGFNTERALQKQTIALETAVETPVFATPGEQLFFCPARVDIDAHYGTYLKKNDMLYRALARLYKERGGGFKILQLEWGHDCDALKQFIADECGDLAKVVIWHKPFSKAVFYQLLRQTALVFDNFLLPLMGGNGIETLMSGHAALVNKRIPDDVMLRFFPEMWPIFAIDGEDGIYAAAAAALDNPATCLALAQQGQTWILKHHSPAAIVAKNCQAYETVLPLQKGSL